MNAGINPPQGPAVGYFLATFPASTETFIHREIAGLRKAGLRVEVYALRRPRTAVRGRLGDTVGSADRFYSRPEGLARLVPANVATFLRNPAGYPRTLATYLREAARLDPGTGSRLAYHFLCGAAFAGTLRRRRIGAIHAHFTAGANVGLAASLLSGVPFSFTAHASGDIFVRPVLLERKVRRARFVACVCDYSRRYLDSVTGFLYSDKLRTVPNGIDGWELQLADRLRSEAQRPGSGRRLRIVSVGSLVGCKGYGTLLEACATLRDRGRDFELLVLGEGPGRAEFDRLVARYRLAGVVRAPGAASHDEVYVALASSEVFALMAETHVAGYRDGFPTVILEAMAVGLPVVSTSISGIPEAVVDGETGLLVRERDPRSAADAIERLLLDAGLRQRMGTAARQRVCERFSAERSTATLRELLRRDRFAGSPQEEA